jgi:hypothetical protein
MGILLLFPEQKQRYANLHAQIWNTPWSPFISLTNDPDKILQTYDKWLASLVTGYPVADMRATNLYTYDIPQKHLIFPDYERIAAAKIEGEVLYIGRNIGNHLIKTEANPYQPGDAINFKPKDK